MSQGNGASSTSLEKFRSGFNAISARVRTSGVAASKTLSEQVTVVSGRMKDLFQTPTPADKLVDEATAETLSSPDWGRNLEICDLVNGQNLNSVDVVRAIKRRLSSKSSVVQMNSLILLETSVKNGDRMFADMASEKVLDEMVKITDDPLCFPEIRNKCLRLIEAWGEATDELRYLPVFEETYKSLRSRGIRFPGRDNESLAPIFTPPQSVPIVQRAPPPETIQNVADSKESIAVARNSVDLLSTVLTSAPQQEALQDELTGTLVFQCRQSQTAVQRIIEGAGDNETLLFEALSVHDDLDKVLRKYESMQTNGASDIGESPRNLEGPAALVAVSANDDDDVGEAEGLLRKRSGTRSTQPDEAQAMAHLDEVIFGKEAASGSAKKEKKGDDDMIVF